MKLDALLLRGLAHELQQELAGAVVRKISQLHDSDFVWTFYRRTGTIRLLMSLSADAVRMQLLEGDESRPGAQTPGAFCMLLRKHVEGARVVGVDTWGMERVLRMRFQCGPDQVMLQVEATVLERNMLLSGVDFKRTWHRPGDSSVLPRVLTEEGPSWVQRTGAGASRPAHGTSLGEGDEPLWRSVVRAAFGVNRLAAEEICAQAGVDPLSRGSEEQRQAVTMAMQAFGQRLAEGRFEPTWSPSRKQGAPWHYSILTDGERCATFSQLFSAGPDANWATRAVDTARQVLQHRLRRHIDRVERRVQVQTDNLLALSDLERWRHCGDLLLSVPPETRAGPNGVHIMDYAVDQWADVPVDPRLSLSANAQMYFNRYKKAVRGQKAIQHQLEQGRMEAVYLQELWLATEQAGTLAEVSEVGELLKGEARPAVEKRQKRPISSKKRTPIHRYRILGFEVLVGRNPRQNEEISLRLANPDDLWLHAREVPGSHVLIRSQGQVVPEAVIERAAVMAAAHSKAATSSKVTVIYTQARHLRKPRETPPGTVTYRHERSIMVRVDEAMAGGPEELFQS